MSYSIEPHDLTGTTLAACLGGAGGPAAVIPLDLDLSCAVTLTGPPAGTAKLAMNRAYDAIAARCSAAAGQYLRVALSLSDNAGGAPSQLDCVLSTQSLQVLGFCAGTLYWEMHCSNYSVMSSPSRISRAAIVDAQRLLQTSNRARLNSDEGERAACLMIFCVSEAAREKTARDAVICALLPDYSRAAIDSYLIANQLQRREPYHTLEALWTYGSHRVIMNNWKNIVEFRDAALGLAPAYRYDVPITLADAKAFHAGNAVTLEILDSMDFHLV